MGNSLTNSQHSNSTLASFHSRNERPQSHLRSGRHGLTRAKTEAAVIKPAFLPRAGKVTSPEPSTALQLNSQEYYEPYNADLDPSPLPQRAHHQRYGDNHLHFGAITCNPTASSARVQGHAVRTTHAHQAVPPITNPPAPSELVLGHHVIPCCDVDATDDVLLIRGVEQAAYGMLVKSEPVPFPPPALELGLLRCLLKQNGAGTCDMSDYQGEVHPVCNASRGSTSSDHENLTDEENSESTAAPPQGRLDVEPTISDKDQTHDHYRGTMKTSHQPIENRTDHYPYDPHDPSAKYLSAHLRTDTDHAPGGGDEGAATASSEIPTRLTAVKSPGGTAAGVSSTSAAPCDEGDAPTEDEDVLSTCSLDLSCPSEALSHQPHKNNGLNGAESNGDCIGNWTIPGGNHHQPRSNDYTRDETGRCYKKNWGKLRKGYRGATPR